MKFKETFYNLKNKYLAAVVGLDIVFVMLFGFVFEFAKQNIAFELENIVKIIGAASVEIAPGVFEYSTLISSLKQLPGFTGSYHSIIWNLVVMIILIFVLWCTLESASWWFSYKLNHIKIEFAKFLKRFFFKSILYFVIVTLGLFVTIRVALGITLQGAVDAGLTVYTFFGGFVVILLILMFLTYGNMDKKLWKILKNWRLLLLTIGMFAALYLLDLGAKYIGGLNYYLMLVFGVVIIMPYLTYIRMFIINELKTK
ncbi:hypothetical protein KY337_03195 [Candidatus Woesearchaeota archaeon]|nr:hypothetical protein [Candidatus Woesearchaeota archaeon]